MAKFFEKFGEWDKANDMFNRFDERIAVGRKRAISKSVLFAEGTAKKHLRNQDLNWQPLKSETVERKERKGLSNKILIATSDYFQSITSFADSNQGFAGVRKRVKNRNGDPITTIAMAHEFGSTKNNIPARPLWRPTLRKTKRWMSRTKVFASEIRKEIIKDTR